MMENNFFSFKAWETAWEEDPAAFSKKMRTTGTHRIDGEVFRRWAEKYNEQSFSEDGKKRTNRIIRWLQNQGVQFENSSVLDIGAASGVFSVPFAEKGASVTSIEPSSILSNHLEANSKHVSDRIHILRTPFHEIALEKNKKFDLVFASMCPAITDWKMVEKALGLAKKYCYISLMAGPKENSLFTSLMPVLGINHPKNLSSDMAYILQLLYLNGYSYQSLITKEMSTVTLTVEEAIRKLPEWFGDYGVPFDEDLRSKAEGYILDTYKNEVQIQQGGRFGKVLVHLENLHMYSE